MSTTARDCGRRQWRRPRSHPCRARRSRHLHRTGLRDRADCAVSARARSEGAMHGADSTAEVINSTAEAIKRARLIAVVRTRGHDEAVLAIKTLAAAGVKVAEISLATPGALAALEQSRALFGETLLTGAGTVRTRRDAEAALSAGARFLISPNLTHDVLAWAHEQAVLHLPGVLS